MFRRIVLLFVGWKVLISTLALFATLVLSLNLRSWLGFWYAKDSPYIFWVWANFDGVHYLDIAQNGYSYPNFAYFPLLPFLIFLLNKILALPFLYAGLVISNVALFFSLFVITKITLLDFDKKIALSTIFFLLIFPLSFFYGSVYTESLYLLTATTSFYFARKGNWFLSGLWGFLAGLTRLVGVSLFPALILEWYFQNRGKDKNFKDLFRNFIKEKVFFLFLVLLGITTYSFYLQINYGDFLLFQKSMSAWGQANFVFPLQVFWRYLKIIFLAPKNFVYFIAILEFFSALFYFALSFYVLKKIRFSYGIFMLTSFIILLFTGSLQSMPRYILHLFPAFLALALLTSKSKWALIISLIFLLLSFLFISLFTRGYFVA